MFKWLFIPFLSLQLTLNALIVEVDHFADIEKYVQDASLVVLDIDDTLLVPAQTLGTDVWFQYRWDFHRKHEEPQVALDKALGEWEAVRHLTEMKIVEDGTDAVIKKLQDTGYNVMGLSTQGLALTSRTLIQLHDLNIDLSKTAPSKEDHYFMNKQGVLFRGGVLFTSGTKKGEALLKLCNCINIHPTKVVFINDKASHLRDLGDTLEAKGIEFIGLRYTFSDDRVNHFDHQIADVQWNHSSFGRILSDVEAKELVHVH